jgi:hypothetical protein
MDPLLGEKPGDNSTRRSANEGAAVTGVAGRAQELIYDWKDQNSVEVTKFDPDEARDDPWPVDLCKREPTKAKTE